MPSAFWLRPRAEIEREFATCPDGLAPDLAAARLKQFGPNLADDRRGDSTLRQMLAFFANPLVLILLVSAGLSAAFGEGLNAALITLMILASVALNFVQSYRSQKAAEALRRVVSTKAEVLRGAKEVAVPVADIVPGDVFVLAAGDIVPADGMLVASKDLFVDQAVLTGESLPAEKHAVDLPPTAQNLDQAVNAVFAGTSVISGAARAIAVKTGPHTAFGGIATELLRQPPPTEFERGMTAFAFLILRVVIALVMFTFLVLALFKRDPLEAFLFSIALAVGLTPEFLPMIVTVTLSRGAMRMAKKRVIVKQLQAIENLGNIDILCSDKTGTLTESAIVLQGSVDLAGDPSPDVLAAAAINCACETGIRSPLDAAVLAATTPPGCAKVDEIPFDFNRRRVSIVAEVDRQRILIAKGAPEAMVPICTAYRREGEDHPMHVAEAEQIHATFERLSRDGLRVLAVAQRVVPEKPAYTQEDEASLTFLGFVCFYDPPRKDAAETIAALAVDGIRVVILTGDNELVTRKVCSEVGLDTRRILLGKDLERISDAALPRMVQKVSVFARVSPDQKDRIVRALKNGGHVVGFLGDGINDAPSLRVADVGISVDTAADVAKEAAPIILLDKSLAVVHDGVIEGRRAFANVVKYLMMGTSSNFGNMFSMAGASLVLPFLPMKPLQILLNNLIYDASQVAIPGDRVEEEALRRPERWNIQFIQRFMLLLGPVSSVFDLITFGLLLYVLHAGPALFQTGWFIESLLTQTLVIFVIRTRKNPFRSRPSTGLVLTVLSGCILAVAIPFTPVGRFLGFVPPPPVLLGAIAAMVVVYLACAEAMKRLFYHLEDRRPAPHVRRARQRRHAYGVAPH